MKAQEQSGFKTKVTLDELNQSMTFQQLAGHLKMHFTEVTNNTLSLQVTVGEIHSRPGGIMSGGNTLVMIETVGSVAGMMMINPVTHNVFGLEVSANHVRQVPIGETITAVAEPDHIGRSTQIWQVRITNSQNKLVCIGRITLFVTERAQA